MFLCSLFLAVIVIRFHGFRGVHSSCEETKLSVPTNRTLRVSIVLHSPFSNLKEDASKYVGNGRYEGFSIDIVREVSEMCGFNYVITPAKDNVYGVLDSDGNWNGMIGEILRNEADIAGSWLAITKDRSQVIAFTAPYITTGLGILVKKTLKKENKENLFAFMQPFTPQLWAYIFIAGLTFSLAFWFIVGLLQDFFNDNAEPSDHGTLSQALWYIFSALLCQGTGSYPHGLSARFLTTIWWFFAFIITTSYTANLAAFLTSDRKVMVINSFEELARQTTIQYGVIRSTSTVLFFKAVDFKPYTDMWHYMQTTEPSVFVANITEGLARVKAGNYALISDRATVDYYAQSDCELASVGDQIRQVGSGMGMKKDLPEKACITDAIFTLIDNTKTTKFWERWRHPAGGACSNESLEDDLPLDIKNLVGIFIILTAGLIVALIMALVEKRFLQHIMEKDIGRRDTLQIAGISICKRCSMPAAKEAAVQQ